MLIDSPRLTRAERAAWLEREELDRLYASTRAFARKEDRALDELERFLERAPKAHVSVSWGKDSTVVAHLAWRLRERGLEPCLAWFPAGAIENPDCALVRDAFLSRFPMRYVEVEASEMVVTEDGHDGAQAAFVRASRGLSREYVSGVRAEESSTRELRMAKWGPSSPHTCAPIGWWTHEDVFGYLAKYDLPTHPAYAMTMGGAIPRERIRVGTIGGRLGRGIGRREWEERYYGEVLRRVEGHHR